MNLGTYKYVLACLKITERPSFPQHLVPNFFVIFTREFDMPANGVRRLTMHNKWTRMLKLITAVCISVVLVPAIKLLVMIKDSGLGDGNLALKSEVLFAVSLALFLLQQLLDLRATPQAAVLLYSPSFLMTIAGGLMGIMALYQYEAALLNLDTEEAKAAARARIQDNINSIRDRTIGAIGIYLFRIVMDDNNDDNKDEPTNTRTSASRSDDIEANFELNRLPSESINGSAFLVAHQAVAVLISSLRTPETAHTSPLLHEVRIDRHVDSEAAPPPYPGPNNRTRRQT